MVKPLHITLQSLTLIRRTHWTQDIDVFLSERRKEGIRHKHISISTEMLCTIMQVLKNSEHEDLQFSDGEEGREHCFCAEM